MPKIFTPTTIVDEVLTEDPRYNILEDGGGAFKSDMQINLASPVTTPGTNLNAALLNNLETGLDLLDTKISDTHDALTSAGTSTAYTLTTVGNLALATLAKFFVKFHVTAGAAPTLNRDSKGAYALKYYDSTGAKIACSATTIITGMISEIVFDGVDYIVLDALPSPAAGVFTFKGTTDTSTNPNYPSAVKGDAYTVSVAGKIGGASGKSVDVGDMYVANVNNAGGTEAAVGTSWFVLEHNLIGALLASNNLSELASPATARTNLGLAIGTNVQAYDADLDYLSTFTPSANVKSILTAATYAAINTLLGIIGLTTKGDLMSFSTIPARVTIGSADGQKLIVDTASASGMKWAADTGWTEISGTWTYASASTITIPTNGTLVYTKGMGIRWKQGGAYKYGVISAVTATLITVLINTDYTVANSAITNMAYSIDLLPYGFPSSWNFTSALTASTTNPTNVTTTGKYTVSNWGITAYVTSTAGASPTNGSGYYIWSLPFASAVAGVGPMHVSDANVGRYTGSAYQSGATAIGITSAGLIGSTSPIATLEVNDEFNFSMNLLW